MKKNIFDYEIVDFHVHIFADKIAKKATRATCDHYRFPSEVSVGDLESLYNNIEGFNVRRLVIHSTATKAEQVVSINNFLLSLEDERFVKFGTMHPDFSDNIMAELSRIKAAGMKGIKLHTDFQFFNADDKKAYPIYEAACELSLPILFHVGDSTCDYSHPRRIAHIARDFPELKIVGAHFGGREKWSEGVKYLAGRENVWVDTSSSIAMLGAEEASKILRAYGTERVFFATDFPMASLQMEMLRFMYLDLTEREREAILHENAEKFLGF